MQEHIYQVSAEHILSEVNNQQEVILRKTKKDKFKFPFAISINNGETPSQSKIRSDLMSSILTADLSHNLTSIPHSPINTSKETQKQIPMSFNFWNSNSPALLDSKLICQQTKQTDRNFKNKLKKPFYVGGPKQYNLKILEKQKYRQLHKDNPLKTLTEKEIRLRNQIEMRFQNSLMKEYRFQINLCNQSDLGLEVETIQKILQGDGTQLLNEEDHNLSQEKKEQDDSERSQDLEQFKNMKELKTVILKQFHRWKGPKLKKQRLKSFVNKKYERKTTEQSSKNFNLSTSQDDSRFQKNQLMRFRIPIKLLNKPAKSSQNPSTPKFHSCKTLEPPPITKSKQHKNRDHSKFRIQRSFNCFPVPKVKLLTKTPRNQAHYWF